MLVPASALPLQALLPTASTDALRRAHRRRGSSLPTTTTRATPEARYRGEPKRCHCRNPPVHGATTHLAPGFCAGLFTFYGHRRQRPLACAGYRDGPPPFLHRANVDDTVPLTHALRPVSQVPLQAPLPTASTHVLPRAWHRRLLLAGSSPPLDIIRHCCARSKSALPLGVHERGTFMHLHECQAHTHVRVRVGHLASRRRDARGQPSLCSSAGGHWSTSRPRGPARWGREGEPRSHQGFPSHL